MLKTLALSLTLFGSLISAVVVAQDQAPATDELKFLDFPLAVNKKWTGEFQDELRGGATVSTRAEMNVSGYQDITTNAGKFKAYKIERYETSAGGGTGKRAGAHRRQVDYVYYYSPETRTIVKFHRVDRDGGTRDIELVKYTPAN